MLKHLKDKSDLTNRGANRSSGNFRVTVGAEQVLPDGETINQLRSEFRGNYEGLSYLEKLLDSRELELSKLVEDQDNKNKVQ